MTDAELIKYYADLLIIQYRGKPKAYANVQAWVDPAIMNQLPVAVQDAFTLGTAEGVQLDVIGKYAGVTRYGRGLDGHAITLNDADFTKFILLAIIENSSGSSLDEIQNLLQVYFAGEIFVFDYQDMRMSYFLNASVISDDLAQVFVTSGRLPKPTAVQLGSTIFSPNIDHFFAFRTYPLPAYNASPFNDYAAYNMDYPWLSYVDAIA